MWTSLRKKWAVLVLVCMRGYVWFQRALAAWEVINEPEGMLLTCKRHAEYCYGTIPLKNAGAGWVETWIPMERMLQFISRQLAAIKQEDPKVLTTVGSWTERSMTEEFGYRNYYSDRCVCVCVREREKEREREREREIERER